MVNISTLYYRVDGFDTSEETNGNPVFPEQDLSNDLLSELLETVLFDPGEELVRKVLAKVSVL
jgi:hypothetical protein